MAPVKDIKLELELALAVARHLRDNGRGDLAGLALIIRHLERVIGEIERQSLARRAWELLARVIARLSRGSPPS